MGHFNFLESIEGTTICEKFGMRLNLRDKLTWQLLAFQRYAGDLLEHDVIAHGKHLWKQMPKNSGGHPTLGS